MERPLAAEAEKRIALLGTWQRRKTRWQPNLTHSRHPLPVLLLFLASWPNSRLLVPNHASVSPPAPCRSLCCSHLALARCLAACPIFEFEFRSKVSKNETSPKPTFRLKQVFALICGVASSVQGQPSRQSRDRLANNAERPTKKYKQAKGRRPAALAQILPGFLYFCWRALNPGLLPQRVGMRPWPDPSCHIPILG